VGGLSQAQNTSGHNLLGLLRLRRHPLGPSAPRVPSVYCTTTRCGRGTKGRVGTPTPGPIGRWVVARRRLAAAEPRDDGEAPGTPRTRRALAVDAKSMSAGNGTGTCDDEARETSPPRVCSGSNKDPEFAGRSMTIRNRSIADAGGTRFAPPSPRNNPQRRRRDRTPAGDLE
jgi:hypothetical protein